MSNWSHLPNELLFCIFSHVDNNAIFKRKNIKNCQLVCKNWSRVAQEVLYQHVAVTRPSKGLALSNTITQAKDIRLLVKKVFFSRVLAFQSNHQCKAIQSIFQYCLNIKELQVGSDEQQCRSIWPLLLSKDNNIKGLEKLTLSYDHAWWCEGEAAVLYKAIALKYKETMKRLDITISQDLSNNAKIHMFPSLQQLRIHRKQILDAQYMNQMLDGCSPSLRNLEIIRRLDSEEAMDLRPQEDTVVNPNTSIKKLDISHGRMNLETLHYLNLKFKGLENLNLQDITPIWISTETAVAWWQHLTSISLKLKQYTYDMCYAEESKDNEILDQLKHCLDVINKTATSGCPRHLTVQCGLEYDSDQLVNMAKAPKSYHLELYSSSSLYYFPFSDTVALLQSYSPDSIKLLCDNVSQLYGALGVSVPGGTGPDDIDLSGLPYRFASSSEIESALNRTFLDTQSDWIALLSYALAILDASKRQNVCIENAILFQHKSLVNLTAKRLSAMSFKACIVKHSILSYISQRVVHIDRLVFDTSIILMDEPYNLNIHLALTSIHTLKLIISPLVNKFIIYFPKGYDYHDCRLENKQLLDAMSPTGQYTLKIETDSKRYVSKRQSGRIVEDNCPDVVRGTRDNFLIWIKCKALEQYLITSDPLASDFELLN